MTDIGFAAPIHSDGSAGSAAGATPERPILEEAWAIAIDLRQELGLGDAIAWADDYLDDLRMRESSDAVARWAVVVCALTELARSSLH